VTARAGYLIALIDDLYLAQAGGFIFWTASPNEAKAFADVAAAQAFAESNVRKAVRIIPKDAGWATSSD
jgi:hypothetical protein